MARITHFEIPANEPEKLTAFYGTVFGWKFSKWDGPMDYWIISTGQAPEPGIDGGLMPRRDPNQPCVNTIGVSNLDETLKSVASPRRSVRGAQDAYTRSRLAGLLQRPGRLHLRTYAARYRGRLM